MATAGLNEEMTGGPSTRALGYSVGRPGTFPPQDDPTTFKILGIGVVEQVGELVTQAFS